MYKFLGIDNDGEAILVPLNPAESIALGKLVEATAPKN